MHCTALGKAILAFSKAEQLQLVLSQPLIRAHPIRSHRPRRLKRSLTRCVVRLCHR